MKIVLAHHYSLTYVGGGEKFLIELVKFLVDRGHEVEVRALPINRRLGGFHVPSGVEYVESWFHRFDADVSYFIYAPLLHRFFKTSAPKIAGLHAPPLFPELQSAEVFSGGIARLVRRTNTYFTLAYLFTRLGLRDWDLQLFDAIHIVNPAMRVKHDRVFYIPMFVDTNFYKPLSQKNDIFTVLFVGRPLWWKGFDIFVETARIVWSRLGDRVQFIATCNESTRYVRCPGFIPEDELPRIYSASHVVVYPSRTDVFPKVILEALASGTPVITTPIPAHKALNLPLIYASTPTEIAEVILELREEWEKSPEEYMRGSEARRKSVEPYDVRRVCEKFEQMLIEVASSTNPY